MERMEVELPIQNMRLVAIPEIFVAQTSQFVKPERRVFFVAQTSQFVSSERRVFFVAQTSQFVKPERYVCSVAQTSQFVKPERFVERFVAQTGSMCYDTTP